MARPWNFGTPKKGEPRIAYRDVRVERGGRAWSASYHIDDGRLVLSSAWGSTSAPAASPATIPTQAQVLLGAMIDARLKGARP
jgi:hypothetical protein